MKFNLYKFKHFYLNKYIVSVCKKHSYHISYDYKHKALWFRTYKVASRTINNALEGDTHPGEYIYGSEMSYLPKMFKNYFKFAFIRNPEDRFLSAWKDKVLRSNYFKFDDAEYNRMKDLDYFISWVEGLNIDECDEHLRSQYSLIDLNNVDFIGRFENFDSDFDFVLNKLNISHNKIETLNQGIKKELDLTKEQRLRIYNIYRKGFQLFYPEHKKQFDL